MGPSGTGKTTLLRLIGGQLKPDNGQILLDEDNIPALSRKELFRVREKWACFFRAAHFLPI